jgi:hypothetical protein
LRSINTGNSPGLGLHACLVMCTIFLGLGTVEARPTVGQSSLASWPAEWQADGAFEATWVRADGPVAMRSTGRSWMWGPVPFAVANEEYVESSTGRRLVEYLDKGRMEVNDPSADRGSPWFVTSGLLVKEMVMGQVQTGNGRFEAVQPAGGVVAGDPGSPNAPPYSVFGMHVAPVPPAVGSRVSTRIGPDGGTSSFSGGGDSRLLSMAHFDEQSGHNVPAVFADWMNQSGPVVEAGRVVQGKLMDPLYVLGRPITEAYWTDVLVGGKPATVMVQLFERRALTYNPSNAPEWQVEMANVGRT